MTDQSVIEGLDFILELLDYQMALWPRTISTKTTQAKQIVVYSRAEAIARFRQANGLDCRISAYAYCRSANSSLPANFVMIDLDLCNFGYDETMLESALKQTLTKIKRLLQYKPTVVWSGNGYHIYIPMEVPAVLENVKELSSTDQVSTKFIRFVERHLSDGKSDQAHNNTVSINNCMLRVPGSINSHIEGPYSTDRNRKRSIVRLIKKPNDINARPHIGLLIGSFYAYLTQQQIDEAKYRQAAMATQYNVTVDGNSNKHKYHWIEKLLETPISDHRKNCVWKILAPYLINVRKLSYDQSFVIMAGWLDKCSKLRRLNFNYKLKIKQDLNNAIKKGYFPVGLTKLRLTNKGLYNMVQQQ